MRTPPSIFIIHDPRDEKHLEALEKQLKVLNRGEQFTFWSTKDLMGGAHIDNTVQFHLDRASLVLALLSSDYFDNEKCIRRHEQAHDLGKTILPVLVRPCNWKYDPLFARLNPIPDKPVVQSKRQDVAWAEVAERVMQRIAPRQTESGITSSPGMPASRRILFMGGNPGTSEVQLGEEIRIIMQQLRLGNRGDVFDMIPRTAVRTAEILQHFRDIKPGIFHFSGHGVKDGGLIFANEKGEASAVDGDALEALFKLFDQVECVLLNACYTETQAKAIHKQIRCVIGMKERIHNQDAIAFAQGFYSALADGESYQRAFDSGVANMKLAGSKEDWMPVLYLRE